MPSLSSSFGCAHCHCQISIESGCTHPNSAAGEGCGGVTLCIDWWCTVMQRALLLMFGPWTGVSRYVQQQPCLDCSYEPAMHYHLQGEAKGETKHAVCHVFCLHAV